MNLEEIKRYTEYGKVCVDIRLMLEYPGIVRKVIFYRKNRVCIEFIGHGYDDEIGYNYCHIFSSLTEAIDSIEVFLGSRINNWINYTKSGEYPNLPENVDREQGSLSLLANVLAGQILLPQKGDFHLIGELPWKTMDDYNAYLEKMAR